jgi:hypothetical protein
MIYGTEVYRMIATNRLISLQIRDWMQQTTAWWFICTNSLFGALNDPGHWNMALALFFRVLSKSNNLPFSFVGLRSMHMTFWRVYRSAWPSATLSCKQACHNWGQVFFFENQLGASRCALMTYLPHWVRRADPVASGSWVLMTTQDLACCLLQRAEIYQSIVSETCYVMSKLISLSI